MKSKQRIINEYIVSGVKVEGTGYGDSQYEKRARILSLIAIGFVRKTKRFKYINTLKIL